MKTLLIIFLFLSSIAYSQENKWRTSVNQDTNHVDYLFGDYLLSEYELIGFTLNSDGWFPILKKISKEDFNVEKIIRDKRPNVDEIFRIEENGDTVWIYKTETREELLKEQTQRVYEDDLIPRGNEVYEDDLIPRGNKVYEVYPSGQGFRQQDSPIDSLRKSIEGEIKLIQQALTKDNTDNIQFLIGKLEALQVVLFEMKKYGLIK